MTWYYRRLDTGLVVMHARPEHADELEALQRVCFPTLADDERFKARHYRKHLELFDEGQFVALDGDRVVGATATIRLHFDFAHINHTFPDIIQGGWLTSHEPDGDWLYGADIGVAPAYRGRGLATALYAARQELVWRRGLEGQVTGGMLRGYGAVKHEMSAEDYYAGVVAGRIHDATLSMQLGIGFEPRALLEGYLNDPVSDNYSALIVLDAAKDVPGASREGATRYVRLHGPVPGPRAKAMLERRAAALPSGLGRATDVVVERAHGALIVDVDGNTFIDMASGIGVTGVGHAPAAVVDAVTAQTRKFLHTCALVTTYEPMVRLAEVLNEITPGAFPKKTIFANSGAESVENAVKLARKYTGRPAVICFEGGYHGRTLLTLSLTSKYGLFKSGFGPFAPEIVRLPIPAVYRTPAGMTEEQYVDFGIRQLEQAFVAQVEPSAVAAVVIEPVQGEAGFIPVPPRFLHRLRELCTEHGIVMIADEVQCGMGRTGRVFACEHYGLVPDLVVSAKSLGGGMPIGAVTGRADIMDASHPGGVGGTYGGNPVACAAALEAVDIIRQPAFLAHARHLGDVMREVMTGWQREWPIVGDVRGLGPMMLVEFVKDQQSKVPAAPEDTLAIVRQTVASGVVLMRAGLYSNGVRLLPPLTMPEDMLREALGALGGAIRTVSDRLATTPARQQRPVSDVVLTGATVLTGRAAQPASTVVVRDGRILAVGDGRAADAAAPGARRIDLEGRTVVPGFNDAHAHVWKIGHLLTTMLDLRGVESIEALVARVAAFQHRLPDGAWLLGRGFNEATMAEGRIPTRADLDVAAPDRPVVLTRTCGHIYATNSVALARAGVTAALSPPIGGEIDLGHDGAPTGVLRETAMGLITRVLPPPADADYERMIEAALRHQLSLGITMSSCCGVNPQLLAVYRAMDAGGRLPARMNVMPFRRVDGVPRPIPLPRMHASDMLRVDTVKFLADGGLSGATAALSVHYRHADHKGMLRFDHDELAALCRESHDAGWRIATHAIGDVAIEQMLDIYEALGPHPRGWGHRIEHLGLPSAAQLARAARLGVIAAPQSIFIHSLGRNFREYLPDELLPRCYPIRAMLDAGVRVALSSDAPVVENDNPLAGMAAAITRRDRDGHLIAPDQAITAAEALAAYTSGGAAAVGLDDALGAIAPGMWADLAVLSGNPLTTPADELPNLAVDMTVLGGRIVYERA